MCGWASALESTDVYCTGGGEEMHYNYNIKLVIRGGERVRCTILCNGGENLNYMYIVQSSISS